jgi:hypothetical protein
MYEAIRVVDMTNFEKVLDPATEGYDEALLILAVNNSEGIQSIDASTLTVVDLSLSEDGYCPPLSWVHTLMESNDLGRAQWLRMQAHLEDMKISSSAPPEAVEMLEDIIKTLERHPAWH